MVCLESCAGLASKGIIGLLQVSPESLYVLRGGKNHDRGAIAPGRRRLPVVAFVVHLRLALAGHGLAYCVLRPYSGMLQSAVLRIVLGAVAIL